jgi:hypothetical protein
LKNEIHLNGVRADDPRSSTAVAFFSTNSTGQLAFLDNLIAIYQVIINRNRYSNVGVERITLLRKAFKIKDLLCLLLF